MDGPMYIYRRRRRRWAYFKCRETNRQSDERILSSNCWTLRFVSVESLKTTTTWHHLFYNIKTGGFSFIQTHTQKP
ncbi:hypothetical protein E1A91_A12G219200v1 [Gossypium mustelinum]|uniref:Uncharacterized protein n=1 Tax=Gossypium mustelinum TaxID=34275 RepID=A0A5D2WYW1_GOSMU|nr:hypothetical protein E1A91_A12G219200v1 [Gossypium mustelinum]